MKIKNLLRKLSMSTPNKMWPVYQKALEYKGLSEIKGPQHNPKILEMFEKVGHAWVKDDETAWCAAFVGFVLSEVGMKGTGKLNARSYLDWGVETKTPRPGDIVVFWRGSKSGWQGHVAIYHGEDAQGIWVVGGNQGDKVSLVPYSKSQLLGYRTLA